MRVVNLGIRDLCEMSLLQNHGTVWLKAMGNHLFRLIFKHSVKMVYFNLRRFAQRSLGSNISYVGAQAFPHDPAFYYTSCD